MNANEVLTSMEGSMVSPSDWMLSPVIPAKYPRESAPQKTLYE